MSRRVDDILAVIDAGLQDSPEASYGDDLAGVCWRCQRAEVSDQSETCESCRLVLTVGPVHGPQLPSVPGSFDAEMDSLCTTEHGCPQPCDDSRCPS